KMSILSIAHLSDQERMFFVTLLLNELVSWMRVQSGTSSLRCLFYMDEIFGYLPPVANPPSKKLFMTLLKQARAFGVGLLLATQNPGDLDYKALSNVGSWFIGRLQTERDKEKVLEGLVTANSGADKAELSKQLSGLGKRVFMLNDTSESHPILFATRWVLSYLAGPIMRNRFKELIGDQAPENAETAAPEAAETSAASAAPANVGTRPVLDPDIPQVFIPGQGKAYQPSVLGYADVLYKDDKLNINETRSQMFVAPLKDYINWEESTVIEYTLNELETDPRDGFGFGEIDSEVSSKSVKAWQNDFVDWLYKGKPMEIYTCETLDAVSLPDEDERAFRIRIAHDARERRDDFVARIRDDYQKEIDTLTRQRERAVAKADTQQSQASSHAMGTAISIGTTILGSLFGSRRSYGGIARQATKIGTTMKERREAADAERSVEELDEKLAAIEEEVQRKVNEFQNEDLINVERIEILPRKADINVKKIALSWKPVEDGSAA
ncbi:MAG: ATP-binding protein, partial [Acidobacteria bacterium]|nr:ATP-binding protein [Acidobacteriota bacterium]